MERQMLELRQEITSLRSLLNPNPPLPTPYGQHNTSHAMAVQKPPQPVSPISPRFHPSSYPQQLFVHGSSNQPLDHQGQIQPSVRPEITITKPSDPAVTPAQSPLYTFVEPSQLQPECSASPRPLNRKKRQTSDLSSEDEYNNSDTSTSDKSRPLKRANHHDRRCLTINVGRFMLDPFFDIPNRTCLPACHARAHRTPHGL